MDIDLQQVAGLPLAVTAMGDFLLGRIDGAGAAVMRLTPGRVGGPEQRGNQLSVRVTAIVCDAPRCEQGQMRVCCKARVCALMSPFVPGRIGRNTTRPLAIITPSAAGPLPGGL